MFRLSRVSPSDSRGKPAKSTAAFDKISFYFGDGWPGLGQALDSRSLRQAQFALLGMTTVEELETGYICQRRPDVGHEAFVFNATRLIAWMFPIIAGTIIQRFGGISRAAMTLGLIYFLGLFVPWFVPETKGKPLPA